MKYLAILAILMGTACAREVTFQCDADIEKDVRTACAVWATATGGALTFARVAAGGQIIVLSPTEYDPGSTPPNAVLYSASLPCAIGRVLGVVNGALHAGQREVDQIRAIEGLSPCQFDFLLKVQGHRVLCLAPVPVRWVFTDGFYRPATKRVTHTLPTGTYSVYMDQCGIRITKTFTVGR